jgi:hypothetical protein
MSACGWHCSSFYFAKGWHFVCRFNVHLFFVVSSFRVSANGLGLGEVGELEVQMFNFSQMPNRITNVQFSTSAPILPNPC